MEDPGVLQLGGGVIGRFDSGRIVRVAPLEKLVSPSRVAAIASLCISREDSKSSGFNCDADAAAASALASSASTRRRSASSLPQARARNNSRACASRPAASKKIVLARSLKSQAIYRRGWERRN